MSSLVSSRWCPECEEICTSHNTICATCGTSLTLRPVQQPSQPPPQQQQQQAILQHGQRMNSIVDAMDTFVGYWALNSDELNSIASNNLPSAYSSGADNTSTTTRSNTSALTTNNQNLSNENNNSNVTATGTTTTATNNSNNNNDDDAVSQTNQAIASVRLVRQDVQMARNELQQLMSTIRARIVDVQNEQQQLLEALRRSRNELNIWESIPSHILDPNYMEPTKKNATDEVYLTNIPRIQLQQDCNLFQYASLSVYTTAIGNADSMKTGGTTETTQMFPTKMILNKVEVIPGEFGATHYHSIYYGTDHRDNSNSTNDNSNHNCSIQLNDAYFVIADPITGKGARLSSSCMNQIEQINNSNDSNKDIVLFFLRGDDVTFVQKAIIGQQASNNVRCVIIGNTIANSPWPYTMKDSKMEALQYNLSIPVVMTSYHDTQIILQQYHYKNNQDIGGITKCAVQIYKQRSDDNSKGCIICTDSYRKNQIVLQLPVCKHTFHEECVLQWLRQHNTCPYCRYELPTQSNPFGQSQRQSNGSSATNQNNTTFYG